MPKCRDRTTTALLEKGYHMVRYPRADIMPLSVFAKMGAEFRQLGDITSVWQSAAGIPTAATDDGPAFEIRSSDVHRGAFGLKILQGLLKHAGGQAAAKVHRKTSMVFSYEAPQHVFVNPLDAGSFLREGEIDLDNPFLAAFMTSDDGQASDFYLITNVLRSRKLVVTVENSNSHELQLDIEALEKLGKAEVSAAGEGETKRSIVYDGDTDLTFAFQAYEVLYANGKWDVLGAGGEALFLSAPSEAPKPSVLSDGTPISLASGAL